MHEIKWNRGMIKGGREAADALQFVLKVCFISTKSQTLDAAPCPCRPNQMAPAYCP